ncbi:hypothetical protein PTTG_27014 [Puccinia triticina 1-1 BBBD Race 1]|uniref:Uncharacterized protein n=1 Tax=Puccinia triticina (isolate 1-1 / race 1 (BBBD)) TaxID=630390 RepID=A0A180GN65_PUCT1|nr:hypothetical protein PTTG_27014 [Puccinia triticina 1-1 BBBD Race 1]
MATSGGIDHLNCKGAIKIYAMDYKASLDGDFVNYDLRVTVPKGALRINNQDQLLKPKYPVVLKAPDLADYGHNLNVGESYSISGSIKVNKDTDFSFDLNPLLA